MFGSSSGQLRASSTFRSRAPREATGHPPLPPSSGDDVLLSGVLIGALTYFNTFDAQLKRSAFDCEGDAEAPPSCQAQACTHAVSCIHAIMQSCNHVQGGADTRKCYFLCMCVCRVVRTSTVLLPA